MPSADSKKFVVAVSGGVDSCVLLHQLVRAGRADAVAHVDHGMRADSADDARFVQALARHYGLAFYCTRLELGPQAGESIARDARYAWLDEVCAAHGAAAVATAHHLDDAIETACINLLRGTGWRGLASLRSTASRDRPLLGMTKIQIMAYAHAHGLQWREDPSNETGRYLRNRVRHTLRTTLTATDRQRLQEVIEAQLRLRLLIEAETNQVLADVVNNGSVARYSLIMMPDTVAHELLRTWLPVALPRARLNDLLRFCRTARAGSRWSFDRQRFIFAEVRVVRLGWDW